MKTPDSNPDHLGNAPDGCGFLGNAEMDAILAGGLDDARQTEFRSHAADCPACSLLMADLDTFRDVDVNGINQHERKEFAQSSEMLRGRLRRQVSSVVTPTRPMASSRILRWGLPMAMAATLLLVMILPLTRLEPGLSHLTLPDGSAYRIEAMLLTPPPILRGEGDADLWGQAGEAYNAGRHKDAARLFTTLTDRRPEEVDAWLYRGVAELLAGEVFLAEATLAQADALAVAQDLSRGAILWYRSLALLAAGRTDEALPSLQETMEVGGLFAPRARDLLTRLGSRADGVQANPAP